MMDKKSVVHQTAGVPPHGRGPPALAVSTLTVGGSAVVPGQQPGTFVDGDCVRHTSPGSNKVHGRGRVT